MKLIVKNFGPIKDVEITFNQLLILIGPQASGKSVLSKLIAIFNDGEFILNLDIKKYLKIYNIEFLQQDTVLEFYYFNFFIKYNKSKIDTNFDSTNINFEQLNNVNTDTLKELDDFNKLLRKIKNEKKIKEELEKFKNKNNVYLAALSIDTFIFMPINAFTFAFETFKIMSLNKKSIIQQLNEVLLDTKPIYIPTERLFISSISDFLFNFIKSDIDLPKCVVNFGAFFEKARKNITNFTASFLNDLEYVYENNTNKVKLNSNTTINLSQTSSGIQAIIPLLLTIEYFSQKDIKTFVIEEPELNLYPITQKKIIEFISQKCLNNNHNVVISTHSPYILTSIANLIQANNVGKMNKKNFSEVNKLIPENFWIDFENVNCYYINNGLAVDILDYENNTIDANAIDDVSELIANEFETLLTLKYNNLQ
jgi:predicted ATPase